MRRRLLTLCLVALVAAIPSAAAAQEHRLFDHVSFLPEEDGAQSPVPQTAPARAFVYSEGYQTRAKIHKIASMATLPLVAVEGFLGESLYNNPTQGKKDAHLYVATSIAALFGINTVTGVWNLVEARKDPNGRTRRMLHGILMLASDAGFVATAATGPGGHHGQYGEQDFEGSRSTHRAIAFTSLGLATAGYLVMLIGR